MRRALGRQLSSSLPSRSSSSSSLILSGNTQSQSRNASSFSSSRSSPKSKRDSSNRPELDLPSEINLTRTAERILNAARDGPSDGAWSYTPDRSKREDLKLRQLASRSGPGSRSGYVKEKEKEEKRRDDELDIPEWDPAVAWQLKDVAAGHYVLVNRAGSVPSGIVLGFQQAERNLSIIYLSASGVLNEARMTDIAFLHPSLVAPSLAARCGLSDFPANDRETQARVEVLRVLRRLSASVERAEVDVIQRGEIMWEHFMRIHLGQASVDRRSSSSSPSSPTSSSHTPSAPAPLTSNALPPLSPSPLDAQWGSMSLSSALRYIFGERTALRIHHAVAMKIYLLRHPVHFVIDRSSPTLIQSTRYDLRPREWVGNLRRVRGWVLDDSEEVRSFVEKANAILKLGREHASRPSSPDSPSSPLLEIPPELHFSPSDREIIAYLQRSMLRQRFVQEDPYGGVVPVLLKRMDGYDGRGRERAWGLSGAESSSTSSPSSLSTSTSPSTSSSTPSTPRTVTAPPRVQKQTANSIMRSIIFDSTAPSEVFEFLKELGLYTKWDQLVMYGADGTECGKRGLGVPDVLVDERGERVEEGEGEAEGEAVRRVTEEEWEGEKRARVLLEQSALSNLPATTATAASDLGTFALDDGLDSIRHDFGDLPVYVIDEADAQELDDGISIEHIPFTNGDEHQTWIHVHVADPTSLIHPLNPLSRAAERMGQTAYFVERTWPMLPPSLTLNRFSLGAAALNDPSGGGRRGQPVMTFSFRLDGEGGEVLDWKVRVGVVRNVRVVSYDAVDKALGAEIEPRVEPLVLPSSTPSTPTNIPTLDSTSTKDLGLLAKFARQLMAKRYQDPNVISWTLPQLEVSLPPPPPGQLLPLSDPNSTVPKLYDDSVFPNSRLFVRTVAPGGIARTMVAEFMIAAGIVASRFGADVASVPLSSVAGSLPTDGSAFPLLHRISPRSTATEADLEAFVSARHPLSYSIPWTLPFERRVIFGSSSYTTEAGTHAGMGAFAYARVTSPLRRFTDLINHWQIKSALRTTLPSSSAGSSYLMMKRGAGKWGSGPFGKDALQLVASEHTHVERMSKRAGRANTNAWALMTIFRALKPSPSSSSPSSEYAKEVLMNLEAVVMNELIRDEFGHSVHHDVYIPALGLQAELMEPEEGARRKSVGERIRVRIRDARFDIVPRLFVELAK